MGFSIQSLLAGALALCSLVNAGALIPVEKRQACTNGPTTRSCWDGTRTVATDPDTNFPPNGAIRSYVFNIQRATLSPDGFARSQLTINGRSPGPTIEANWGDTIRVTVNNQLTDNGTDIHWHGVRQLNTNIFDGTPGASECPLAPGQSKTYIFRATQYGTSWYHSHFPSQYSDGVFGAIVIHGPATANYDIDLGPVTLNDWYHQSFFQVAKNAEKARGPPTADNILINGSHVSASGGQYTKITLTPGKKHLLRFINSGTNNYFHVSLDNHDFTVVAADFNAITPYTTSSISMGIGQRYDVIINANQVAKSYWLRVQPGGGGCDGPVAITQAKAIFQYSGVAATTPTTTASTIPGGCYDESVVPFRSTNVPTGSLGPKLTIGFQPPTATTPIFWTVNSSPLLVNWTYPLLARVRDGNTAYGPRENVNIINNSGWTYWIINQDPNIGPKLPHPIHLHGHDFFVIAQGTGDYTTATLKYNNPIRRDTATLPAAGYLILAFKTDNPGAWLMHCHIAFHAEGGFGNQFLERSADAKANFDFSQLAPTCNSWKTYYGTRTDEGSASGIKG